ncbi:hypothetical protein EVAR_59146_1 [Eumeta japonica]|uniref:Uncharacterized protein n=1 Tax=Eumeta variegata TaxID=151549 RepID=A0A4C1Z957_EUMVA|nr:hypothetical protein EVAR_59146_1 [Eumeta japonica]
MITGIIKFEKCLNGVKSVCCVHTLKGRTREGREAPTMQSPRVEYKFIRGVNPSKPNSPAPSPYESPPSTQYVPSVFVEPFILHSMTSRRK